MDINKKYRLSFFADKCENEICEGEEKTVLNGLFSVSPTRQVRFAPGNLAENGRSFVAHQWEYGGYFGWGTGNNPGNTSTDYLDYPEFNDWGDYIEGRWRTLSRDEWGYVIGRAYTFGTAASGTVNGVHGLILLPDDWSSPTGCTFTAGMKGWEINNALMQHMTDFCQTISRSRLFETLRSKGLVYPTLRTLCGVIEIQPLRGCWEISHK